MICSHRNCDQEGHTSLSEKCGMPYNGKDTPLAFCDRHIDVMLDYYLYFKTMEADRGLVPFIRTPFSLFFYKLSEQQLLDLERLLTHVLSCRLQFQKKIKQCPNMRSDGHEHWLANIREALLFVDHRLWHPVVRRKSRKRKPTVELW